MEIYEHLITLVHSLKTTQSKLVNLATKDMLTGLYNRNYFNEAMARETARAKRFGEQMSVLIIDVDGFKSFNDNFGHLHGDGILRECASDNYCLSFSVGCAVWKGRGDILATIEAADLSMYESKRTKGTPR